MAIVVWLVVMEALYVRAVRVLGGRGVHVPRGQIACWHLGLGLQAVALLLAIPVYVAVLYGWHLTFAFEGAVRHDLVHVLQHACFIFAGILVWWPALEPKRRRLRGELWKIGHIISARMLGMFLGMAFVLIREPVYTGVYDPVERRGISAIADQQTAGAMMVALDIGIMVFALSFFFWHAAQQHDRDEARAAAGLSPR